MEILSIIPARGGSTEIPLKNIVKIRNKPLIYYTIKASLNSSLVNRTVVSTDNEKIKSISLKLGAEVIDRPKKLSGNKIALEPAIFHALQYLQKKESYVPDVVVLLQNTSPLRTNVHIDEAIMEFKKHKYDSLLSGYASHNLYFKLKNHRLCPMNFSIKKWPNRQDIKTQYVGNGAIYISTHNALQKSKCRISGKIGIYKMPQELSLEIDSKFDLFLTEELLKRF